ncbi:unnamed protein product [Clonostachys rosea f. rosea IK726]|uniref:Copper transport protein n=2 Tax=Bionectria ochroleuca TaxID=29856 RepID=A0A0B7KR24_BIOOC|nr:unnamed protein product [Clonostachys rosea f. rosea IK726]
MDHSSSMSSSSDCKISMLWNWYTVDACFLSSTWHIENNAMFAASCIGVVLLVVVLELLRRLGKEYDNLILRHFQRHVAAQTSSPSDACCSASPVPSHRMVTFRASPLQQLVRAVIYGVTFGVAYIVMLLAMYFNGYIIISIIIGATLGKFLCDWMVHKVAIDGKTQGGGPATGIEETTVCCS